MTESKHRFSLLSLYLLWINVFGFQIIARSETPSIESGSQGVVHSYEGDDALLTCVIRGAKDNTVVWKFEDKNRVGMRILTAGDNRVTSDRRFHVLHDVGGDVWVLAIKKVKPSDSGIFTCEVNSDPVVRSFHKLSVLSRELQPPNENSTTGYGTDEVVELEERSGSASIVLNHNYSDCCRALNVSAKCLGFCVIQNILEGNTGQDPEQCETDFPSIVHCMADGRNHVPCCVQEGVPDICQDVCRGEYTIITDSVKTHFSCSAYTEQTLACIVEGIELLPSRPADVQIDVLSYGSLNISWNEPSKNSASVTEYAVNVTMLKTFDNDPILDRDSNAIKNQTSVVIRPHSVQVKVPASEHYVVIKNLSTYTMYEVTVLAMNKRGSSLPSYSARIVTLPVGKTKDSSVLKPPSLPDIRGCCVKKGITHTTCLEKLCDPSKSDETEVTDLMICAPWAAQTYSCLTNGIDHTSCCEARGLPTLCQELCSGNLTQMDYNYFKCLRYMDDYTHCLMRGYGVLPGPPTTLQLKYIDTTFVILEWDKPKYLGDTVDHYNVHYRRLDDIYYISRRVQSPYIIEGLRPDTKYEVYVVAVNSHGSGSNSVQVIFSTLSVALVDREEQPIERKYNVTQCCTDAGLGDVCLPLCSYNASMSQLKALAGVCGAEFYKLIRCGAGGRNHVECCKRRGVPNNCLSICSGVIAKTVLNEPPNMCIPFIGNIVQCFEEGTDILPGPVSELRATKITNTSLTLEWVPPKDGNYVHDYAVNYEKVDNISSQQDTSLTLDKGIYVTEPTVKLENLEPSQMYKIFVVSRNFHGTSLPSSMLLVNTTEKEGITKSAIAGVPSPPHSLAVSSHSANYVTVTWQPPEFSHPSERLKYRLYWKGNEDGGFHMVEKEITSHMIEGLNPNSQYVINVVASSQKGDSLPSETLIAWTDPAFPAFVERPTIHPQNMVVEGNSMTVLCIAMGTPMPTISLYISGCQIKQEVTRHMVAVINNVTRDMNYISCYADNGYGAPMQASRKIVVNYAPRVMPSGITMAAVGDTVNLECIVDSHPEPKMMFWKDPSGRIPVIQSGKYSIETGNYKEDSYKYKMQLIINKISDSDSGEYYCHAENAFGSDTQIVSVRIRNTPMTHNATECCIKQNVSFACVDLCSPYLDINTVIDRPECLKDLDKLIKCASDGSDHRNCCASLYLPRSCLDWCRGEPIQNNQMCLISYSSSIMSCFREGRTKLPGPPQNVHVDVVDSHAVIIKWDPPIKNPNTVDVYRVFWRAGNKTAMKNDTKETSLLITGLKEDVNYDVQIKASNKVGSSRLTDLIKFNTREKYITTSSRLSDDHTVVGTAFSVVLAFIVVGGVLIAAIYFIHSRQLLSRKSTSGVAFENPSYLRETYPGDNTYMGSGIANGVALNSQHQTQGWKNEQLHVPNSSEVAPSLYEELRLGSDGAGFMRLKP